MKSRFGLEGVSSMFGADSATPAPCTSTITAIAKAPVTSEGDSSDSCGNTGLGRPLGIVP